MRGVGLNRFWSIAIISTVAALVLGAFASWIAFPALLGLEGQRSAAWGVLLAVWGLGLAVIGFAVTWWQLIRTKTAAEAVAAALSVIRRDYASFSVSTELRSLQGAIDAASSALKADRWPESSAAFEQMRSATIKVIQSRGRLTDAHLDGLKDQALFINDALDLLTKHRAARPPASSVNEVIGKLREFHSETIALEFFVRDMIHGD